MRVLATAFLALMLPCVATASDAVPSAYIDEYARSHGFSGTIAMQRGDGPVFRASYGKADLAHGVPNRPDTRYRIASITKLFTSVLVLQLEAEGKLALGDPLSRAWPDFAGGRFADVTVEQLLRHTSGLPNFDAVKDAATAIRDGIPQYQKPWSVDGLIGNFCSGASVSAPGKVFSYNNCDYIVLGRIVERIEGKPFESVLRDRIVEPLGLTSTRLLRQSDIVDNLASTYFKRDDLGRLANDLPVYPENWFTAGSMVSTVDDLVVFTNALFGGKLLPPKSIEALLKPGLDDFGLGAWSYAMKVDGRDVRIFKRPGQIMGAQAQLVRLPDHATTLVILSNQGTVDLDQFVADVIRHTRFDQPPSGPVTPGAHHAP